MNRKLFCSLSILAAAAFPVLAGEYHSGGTLICADCHTAHFSMQHNWEGTVPVPTSPTGTGPDAPMDWLGPSGPNPFLLKAPASQLCLTCHDTQNAAPDVYGINTNGASYAQGRSAGGINDPTYGAPYESWKGHTLSSTLTPPGWNPVLVGAPPSWYDPANGLDCIDCHAAHGPADSYRNLGAFSLGSAATAARPTYVISTTNDTTKDVWINIPTGYRSGTGNPAIYAQYYDQSNIFYNRNDAVVGTTKTSNRMDTFCATCHGNFHGGPGDTNIGGLPSTLEGFIRHPTSQDTIGSSSGGIHSTNSRYVTGTTRVKVYSSQQTFGNFTDATPGCVSCHKAHGNQNPFGLIYLNRNAVTVDEQGGWASGEIANDQNGTRNLCGQCHDLGDASVQGFSTAPTTPATSSRRFREP